MITKQKNAQFKIQSVFFHFSFDTIVTHFVFGHNFRSSSLTDMNKLLLNSGVKILKYLTIMIFNQVALDIEGKIISLSL